MTEAGKASCMTGEPLEGRRAGEPSYGYDGDGRRVRVTDNGTAVVYVYSSICWANRLLEANSTGNSGRMCTQATS
ncbi:MAG: hypothetical protein U0X75_28990 [Acidobacteriota bacterium]